MIEVPMALTFAEPGDLGSVAPSFSLPGVDGKTYSLDSFTACRGVVIVFMCNHCPYVVAVHARLSKLARKLSPLGIGMIGINANDPDYREADSFENMVKLSQTWGLAFPYVFDEAQTTARAYGAVCTPDPYLFKKEGEAFRLYYRGRIDDAWSDENQVKEQSLEMAAMAMLRNETAAENVVPSIGCSIKWKKE